MEMAVLITFSVILQTVINHQSHNAVYWSKLVNLMV